MKILNKLARDLSKVSPVQNKEQLKDFQTGAIITVKKSLDEIAIERVDKEMKIAHIIRSADILLKLAAAYMKQQDAECYVSTDSNTLVLKGKSTDYSLEALEQIFKALELSKNTNIYFTEE